MTDRQLRIGITCYPTFGGSGVVATEIGMAMARRGHQVHIISYDVPRRLDRFMENIYFHEVEVQDYPLFPFPPYALSLASKMAEVAAFEKLDLLHVHYAVPHATSAFLAKQILQDQAPKVITTLHGTDITLVGNDRGYLPITRFSIHASDRVTVPSLFLRHATYDKLNVSTELAIDVIPNFVDTDKFKPKEPGSKDMRSVILSGCSKPTRTLIHVSNFRPVKRLDDTIKVLEQVNQELSCHLILIGDGPERSRIENEVRDRGLRDKVCFLGKQENFVSILQHADVFLLPSATESFGLAALEAQSCGVPVVASRVGGIPEVIEDAKTGFLADVGDTQEMANHVLRLLSNQELYNQVSAQARQRVLENFDVQLLSQHWENYYYQTIE